MSDKKLSSLPPSFPRPITQNSAVFSLPSSSIYTGVPNIFSCSFRQNSTPQSKQACARSESSAVTSSMEANPKRSLPPILRYSLFLYCLRTFAIPGKPSAPSAPSVSFKSSSLKTGRSFFTSSPFFKKSSSKRSGFRESMLEREGEEREMFRISSRPSERAVFERVLRLSRTFFPSRKPSLSISGAAESLFFLRRSLIIIFLYYHYFRYF